MDGVQFDEEGYPVTDRGTLICGKYTDEDYAFLEEMEELMEDFR